MYRINVPNKMMVKNVMKYCIRKKLANKKKFVPILNGSIQSFWLTVHQNLI